MNFILFLIQLYLPGLAGYLLIQRRPRLFDLIFTSFVTGALLNTLTILALSALRLYTPKNWLIASFGLGALIMLIAIFKIVKNKVEWARSGLTWKEFGGIFVILILFVIFFRRPTEFVLHHFMDNTCYMNLAGYQLTTGTLFMEDNQFQIYTKDFPNAEYHSSSFDGSFREGNFIEIHFPPLWRMTLSMPLYWGGLGWAVLTCFLVSVLSGIFFWEWARGEFSNRIVPYLGTAALMLAPIFIQYSKIQMSEPIMILYLIVSFYLLQRAAKEENKYLAGLAALFFSSVILIKADALMLIPTFFCLPIFLMVNQAEDKKRTFAWFGLFASLFSFICFNIVHYLCRRYMIASYNELFLSLIFLISLLYTIFFALLLYFPKINAKFFGLLAYVLKYSYSWVINLAFLFVSFLIVIRQPTVLDWFKKAFRSASFDMDKFFFPMQVVYSFIGIPLLLAGAFGLWLLLIRKEYRYFAWLSVFFFIAIMGLLDPFHSLSHFWAARRYLTSLFPLLVISFMYLYQYLNEEKKEIPGMLSRIVTAVIFLCFISYNYVTSKEFVFSDPVITDLNEFGKKLPENSVYLIDGEPQVAIGLQLAVKYYYGREALSPKLKSLTDAELSMFVQNKFKEGKLPLITLPEEEKSRLSENFRFRKLFDHEIRHFSNPVVTVYKIKLKTDGKAN